MKTKKNYDVIAKPDNWINLEYRDKNVLYRVWAQVFDTPSQFGIGARDNEGNGWKA